MSKDLEPNDDLENDDLKDELLEADIDADILIQEEIEGDDFTIDDKIEEADAEDIEEEKESINNSINFDDSESELDVYFK